MSAAFMLVLGMVFVFIAATGRWKNILAVVRGAGQ